MSSSTNSIVWKRPGTGKERLFRRQVAAMTHVARFSLQFLILLIVGMKTLTVIKLVSIKLQKKSNDIFKAYNKSV